LLCQRSSSALTSSADFIGSPHFSSSQANASSWVSKYSLRYSSSGEHASKKNLSLKYVPNSSFVSYLFRPTYWICALSAVFTVFLYCVIYWLLFMVIVHSEGSVKTIASFYIPSALYTSVMTLALCALIMPLKRKLNKEVEFEK
jgi:hypothetical protein